MGRKRGRKRVNLLFFNSAQLILYSYIPLYRPNVAHVLTNISYNYKPVKKILIVNNDLDTMFLLKSWLEKRTYTVKYTGKHDEVNRIVKEFNPDLLIVDILQKHILEELEVKDKHIPVLIMTGYSFRPKTNKLTHDIIEKPFNLSLLEKKIEELVYQGSAS